MFENIISIEHYGSAYELIDSVECINALELSDDEKSFLKSLNDYDGMNFFLVNSDTVIVSDFFGDVSGSAIYYDDFLKNTIEYVKENA